MIANLRFPQILPEAVSPYEDVSPYLLPSDPFTEEPSSLRIWQKGHEGWFAGALGLELFQTSNQAGRTLLKLLIAKTKATVFGLQKQNFDLRKAQDKQVQEIWSLKQEQYKMEQAYDAKVKKLEADLVVHRMLQNEAVKDMKQENMSLRDRNQQQHRMLVEAGLLAP